MRGRSISQFKSCCLLVSHEMNLVGVAKQEKKKKKTETKAEPMVKYIGKHVRVFLALQDHVKYLPSYVNNDFLKRRRSSF